jgi:hypothetical protein
MKPDRRQFLVASAALAGVRIAQGQETSFTLQFPPVTLDVSEPVSFAMAVSAQCTLEAQLVGEEDRPLFEVLKWGMESRRAASVLNQSVKALNGEKSVGLRAKVYPSGGKKPHLGGVIQTGHVAQTGFVLGAHESDKHRLERTAQKVLFIKDPAPRTEEGHFTVDLRVESNLLLKIWRGENQTGPLVHERLFRNLREGENPIPWNLRDKRQSVVDQGEYLATLAATPSNARLSNSVFVASFQVV